MASKVFNGCQAGARDKAPRFCRHDSDSQPGETARTDADGDVFDLAGIDPGGSKEEVEFGDQGAGMAPSGFTQRAYADQCFPAQQGDSADLAGGFNADGEFQA